MPFQEGQSGNPSTQFQKGQTGNQAGRPRSAISHLLREYGDAAELHIFIEKIDTTGKRTQQQFTLSTCDQTINKTVAAIMWVKALNGDIRTILEILNRTEGRVPHPIVTRNARQDGAELVAWTAEDLDEFFEWKRQRDAVAQGLAGSGISEELSDSLDPIN